jgi:hypothetical protein
MAETVSFESAARSSDHVAVAPPRANEPAAGTQVSRPRPAGGSLRPSQVPVTPAATRLTGSPFPAGRRPRHQLQRLRPSGSMGAGLISSWPSTAPPRPVPDVLRGPSQPLAAPVKEEMEARLGADLSDVRIHTDGAARASAAELGARAYTCGSHVVIGDRGADKHTLAHELTHVIQQRLGPVAGTRTSAGLRLSDPSDCFERRA